MILEMIVISILGTLLHFTYDWSNHNKVVALFSAVNESTWEHIKLAFSATIFCSIFDSWWLGSNPNYFFGKFVSLVLIVIIMPSIFYGYTHFTKRCILAVDIASFFVTVIVSTYAFYWILDIQPLSHLVRYLGTVGLFAVFGSYMVLTLMPLKNFMFLDPVTVKYGIEAHK